SSCNRPRPDNSEGLRLRRAGSGSRFPTSTAARDLPALVRRARLVAPRASIGAAGKSPGRPFGATDRPDRRRQDAGGVSADAGGAFFPIPASEGRRQDAGLHRTRRGAQPRSAYAVHFAAEGARGRYRTQPGNAGRGDGAADQGRNPYRRHAGVAAAATTALSAGYFAYHAGATGVAAVVR